MAARSEITPYLGLTVKLMFLIAAKRLLWADGKAEDVIIHLNVNTMVGRDLRARRKKKNRMAAQPDEGGSLKIRPPAFGKGFGLKGEAVIAHIYGMRNSGGRIFNEPGVKRGKGT